MNDGFVPYIDTEGRIKCHFIGRSGGRDDDGKYVAKSYTRGAFHELLVYRIVRGELVTHYWTGGIGAWTELQLPIVEAR